MPNLIATLFPNQSMTETTQIADVTVQLDTLHSAYSELLAQAAQTLEEFEFRPDVTQIRTVATEIGNNSAFRGRVISEVINTIRRDLISFKNMPHAEIPITYRVAIELLTARVTAKVEEAALERLSGTIDAYLQDPDTQKHIDSMFRLPPDMEELKVKAKLWDTMIESMVTANLSLEKAVTNTDAAEKEV